MPFAVVVGEAADRARWAMGRISQYNTLFDPSSAGNQAIRVEARDTILPAIDQLRGAAAYAPSDVARSAAVDASNKLAEATHSLSHSMKAVPSAPANIPLAVDQINQAIRQLDVAQRGAGWSPSSASFGTPGWQQHSMPPTQSGAWLPSGWGSSNVAVRHPPATSGSGSLVHFAIDHPGDIPGIMNQIEQAIRMIGAGDGPATWSHPAGSAPGVEVLIRRRV